MKECTKCNKIKDLSEYSKNSSYKDGLQYKCKLCCKQYYQKNKDLLKERSKLYKEKNKEYCLEWQRKYYQENKELINKKNKEYRRNRFKTDVMYRLKHNVRSRVNIFSKRKKYKKKYSSIKYLGCDFSIYRIYIENRFKEGMTWDNYGEWHIDHIMPLASAKTEEELMKLFHYTNTQPLWAEENIKKGAKIL